MTAHDFETWRSWTVIDRPYSKIRCPLLLDYNFDRMKRLACFLVLAALAAVVAGLPAYADSDLTLFGAAQHQGKLNFQTAKSTLNTAGTTFNPGSFGTF